MKKVYQVVNDDAMKTANFEGGKQNMEKTKGIFKGSEQDAKMLPKGTFKGGEQQGTETLPKGTFRGGEQQGTETLPKGTFRGENQSGYRVYSNPKNNIIEILYPVTDRAITYRR